MPAGKAVAGRSGTVEGYWHLPGFCRFSDNLAPHRAGVLLSIWSLYHLGTTGGLVNYRNPHCLAGMCPWAVKQPQPMFCLTFEHEMTSA